MCCVVLLQAGTFEVLLLHLACLFDSYSNTMLFTNGMLYKRPASAVSLYLSSQVSRLCHRVCSVGLEFVQLFFASGHFYLSNY